MTVTWVTEPSSTGFLKPPIAERYRVEIPLVATSDTGVVEFSIIAGSLPRGLRLVGSTILGSPVEVKRYTESRFVVRATDGDDIKDRTFKLAVDGSDAPQWVTREGFLNVGQGENYFALDNSFVDYQLDVNDPDLVAGDSVEFYLAPNGGELPPGLRLTKDGKITGFTDPVFAVDVNSSGGYDTMPFDISYFDRPELKTTGYDSYYYDTVSFDYAETSLVPRRLSRFYTFIVVATDGVNDVRRLFRIWVVSEDFLKSSNSMMAADTGLFRADNSSYRTPIWITPSDLGKHRANNYLTVFLDVYDPPSLTGTITYLLDVKNPDGSPSLLPPGMVIDSLTGEIAGRVPYQERISKIYTFTVQAVNYPFELVDAKYVFTGDWDSNTYYIENRTVRYLGQVYICIRANKNQVPNVEASEYWISSVTTSSKTFHIEILGEVDQAISWISDSDLGSIRANQPSTKELLATSNLSNNRLSFELIRGNLPTGLTLIGNGLIQGKVKQFADAQGPGLTRFYDTVNDQRDHNVVFDSQTTSFDRVFNFTVKATDARSSAESAQVIASNEDAVGRGTKYLVFSTPSVLYLTAGTPIYGTRDNHPIKTRKYVVSVEHRSDSTSIVELNAATELPVPAGTVVNIGARSTAESIKDFYLKVEADNSKTYANLFLVCLQSKEKRLAWSEFITNNSIFKPEELYRFGDDNFSTQSDLRVLLYAGIESTYAYKYVQAMSRNHYRKQLRFGDVKFAVAKDPLTQQPIYEAVYVEVVDDLQTKTGTSISSTIQLPDYINSPVLVSYDAIKVDSDIPFVSDRNHQRVFPNSFKNMRSRIQQVGSRDRSFLPLWMRSIQDKEFVEYGYVSAVVLCYAKPGCAINIISRIKNRTQTASRGTWNYLVTYRQGDTVKFQGRYYTATTVSTNKHPEVETQYWMLNFDFKQLDFTADRYLIDVLENSLEDKYLVFPQRGEKLP